MKLRYYIVLILINFSIFSSLTGQTEPPAQLFQLHVEGHISNLEDVPLPGSVVQIIQGGKVFASVTTDGTGKYSFDLPLNADFVVSVSRPGFAAKKYSISTRGVPPERATSKFSTIDASLSLFEKIEGVNYSALDQPLNKYYYSGSKENFEYDKAYLDQMIGVLQNLQATQQAAIEKAKNLEADYQNGIKNGDKAFQKKDWAGAKAAYGQATALKPNENYPKDQMKQVDKIIADQEALNKKNAEDAKKKEEEAV